MFSGLSALVIEDVADGGQTVQVSSRTRNVPVPCPPCGVLTGRVHGYHGRTGAGCAGRQVVVRVRIRRLLCPVRDCDRQTFRKQTPGLLERHQRGTTRLTGRLSELVKELCGRTSARLTRSLAVPVSYASALRLLRRVPLPAVRIPRVIGGDGFALRCRYSYATIVINAETGRRIEALPGREAATLEAWLRGHPGIEAVRRDGSATYAEAVRRAPPDAVQISDRWHLWHNIAEAVRKEVAAHSICWAKAGPPPAEGRQAATTRERRQQVHALRERGVGLLECARRLNLALNTVKRYDHVARARAPHPRPQVPPHPRGSLPRSPAPTPAGESGRPRHPSPPGDQKPGAAPAARTCWPAPSTRAASRPTGPRSRPGAWPAACSPAPTRLGDHPRERIEAARTACQEMTALADLIHGFAALLDPADGNAALLSTWITATQTEDLHHLHTFTRGLEKNRAPVDAALTLPHHNGGTEGVNNKTKLIKRQMCGRASFPLLRHRILLGRPHPPPPPTTEQTRTIDRPHHTNAVQASRYGPKHPLRTSRAHEIKGHGVHLMMYRIASHSL